MELQKDVNNAYKKIVGGFSLCPDLLEDIKSSA